MPRPFRKKTALRTIRNATGLSQPQFGSLVGVSGETIEKIENEKLGLSSLLAIKIRAQTGCGLTSNGKGGYALSTRNVNLQPYSHDDFRAHRAARLQHADEDLKGWIDGALGCVEMLFRAADRGGKLYPVASDFETFVSATLESYNLRPALSGLLEGYSPAREDLAEDLARGLSVIPIRTGASFWHNYVPTAKKISRHPAGVKKGSSRPAQERRPGRRRSA